MKHPRAFRPDALDSLLERREVLSLSAAGFQPVAAFLSHFRPAAAVSTPAAVAALPTVGKGLSPAAVSAVASPVLGTGLNLNGGLGLTNNAEMVPSAGLNQGTTGLNVLVSNATPFLNGLDATPIPAPVTGTNGSLLGTFNNGLFSNGTLNSVGFNPSTSPATNLNNNVSLLSNPSLVSNPALVSPLASTAFADSAGLGLSTMNGFGLNNGLGVFGAVPATSSPGTTFYDIGSTSNNPASSTIPVGNYAPSSSPLFPTGTTLGNPQFGFSTGNLLGSPLSLGFSSPPPSNNGLPFLSSAYNNGTSVTVGNGASFLSSLYNTGTSISPGAGTSFLNSGYNGTTAYQPMTSQFGPTALTPGITF
jgi:hypothetical protein